MSRLSIRAFLVAARRQLEKTVTEQTPACFVIGNESADLDSITCALLYGYILSSRQNARIAGKYVIPITNIPRSDLTLRPELTALLRHADIKPSELITLDDLRDRLPSAEKLDWTLVDHNAFQGRLGQLYRNQVSGVIDHHDEEKAVSQHAEPRIIQKSGSCSSLVTNYLRDTWQQISDSASTVGAAHPQDNERLIDDFAYTSGWDAQAAKLALGAILIDTINMQAEHKITEADVRAVKFLEAKIHVSRRYGKDYERNAFFKEINEAKSDLSNLSVEDILRKDYKQWSEEKITLGISSVVKACQYLARGKDEDFLPTLVKFAENRALDVFAIMTAFNEKDTFRRQLLLIALNDRGKEVANKFVKNAGKELQLVEGANSPLPTAEKLPYQRFWDQKSLEASRKQVAPLLRNSVKFLNERRDDIKAGH